MLTLLACGATSTGCPPSCCVASCASGVSSGAGAGSAGGTAGGMGNTRSSSSSSKSKSISGRAGPETASHMAAERDSCAAAASDAYCCARSACIAAS